jgi:hypothetical protein
MTIRESDDRLGDAASRNHHQKGRHNILDPHTSI